MTIQLHLAKVIMPISSCPIIDGALLVEDSKILKVGRQEDFGDYKDKKNKNYKVVDHKDSLICPGFINLHTHLLYSGLTGLDGTNGLFPWLESLIDFVSSWQEEDYKKSIRYGIKEAIESGTTYIVENTPSDLSIVELGNSPLKALAGIEIFGSDEILAKEIFNFAKENLESIQNKFQKHKNLDFTFSPHAPYDVSISLWRELLNWSQKNNKPLLTHLEESPQEKLWWNEKSGPALSFWEKINTLEPKLKNWKKYNSGISFLQKNNLLSENIIAAHLCQASGEELKKLKENNINLVHCPRSNSYLNNGTSNLKLWNDLGLIWGIGTDSIASNYSLDLLSELRYTIKLQEQVFNYKLPTIDAIKAITYNAAKILSKENEIGSLKEGNCADLLVYNIEKQSEYTNNSLYDLLVRDIDNKKDLKEVWINGEIIWQRKHLVDKIHKI